MMRYIGDTSNLKRIMNLLRDPSKAIQFEAFHVFKVFVMNPEKNAAIVDLLTKNKEKLTDYLTDFHKDRSLSLSHFLCFAFYLLSLLLYLYSLFAFYSV